MILRGLATGPSISAAEVEMHTAAENLSDAMKRSSRIQECGQDVILSIRSGNIFFASESISILFHRVCVSNVKNLNSHHGIDQSR
jgi:hypothetical protein